MSHRVGKKALQRLLFVPSNTRPRFLSQASGGWLHHHHHGKQHGHVGIGSNYRHLSSASSAASSENDATTTPEREMNEHARHMETRRNEFEEYRKFLQKTTGTDVNWNPFPSNFTPTISVPAFIEKYSDIEAKARLHDEEIYISGRIISRRDASKNLIFVDIVGSSDTEYKHDESLSDLLEESNEFSREFPFGKCVQVMLSKSQYQGETEKFRNDSKILRIGDVIGIRGFPGKTGTGELSVIPTEVQILSPCMIDVPLHLNDPNSRYRKRYMDLRVNQKYGFRFVTRSLVIKYLRNYLESRGFLEVETPTLWPHQGGAIARPFITQSNAFGKELDLNLRIAPELFLKQLVIGGIERVFEIGKVYRNEGVDHMHNPEFTICEFYQTHATHRDLMAMTQDIVRGMVALVTGGKQTLTYQGVEIDVSKEFQQLDVMETLEKKLERKLPDPNAKESLPEYVQICHDHNISLASPYTLNHVLDKLIGHFIEPMCVQPTFIMNHPVVLSPLAKANPENPTVTDRFELFICGHEVCNSYTELNDPDEQRARMHAQKAHAIERGGHIEIEDDASQSTNEEFCEALFYGLPPTAGWGMGIDRMIMLLTNAHHIREVLLFPMMKPLHHSETDNE